MNDTPRIRLAAVGLVVLSLFASLFARLWYLQVLDSDTFVAAAAANQVRIVYEEAPRGRILDRHGRVVVDNRVSTVVTVQRGAIDEEVKVKLAALLGLTVDQLDERLADQRFSLYRPVPVAQDVPEEIAVYLSEHQADFPGVKAEPMSQRDYPHGSLAAHLVGYVGEINDRELEERKAAGYRLGDEIGKSGVERVYEQYLRGAPGVTKLQVDAQGNVQGPPLGHREPVQGHDVQLTIDLDIQRLAEESLVKALEAARTRVDRLDKTHFVAPAGSVVVLDPTDGSVLAMASYPTFNPAEFVNGIKPSVYATLQDPANHYPLNNRAVMGQYAPGSTFKLITAVAALQRGIITSRTTITDGGVYRVPGCRSGKCEFQNAGRQAYGRVDVPRSLTVSSDVYYYKLGADFWLERDRYGHGIQETARQFGLGARTGIPLPTDKAGVVPDPEWRREFCTKVRCIDDRWYTGDNINMAIGQGNVLVTPLQLANTYATFANGGTLWEPRIGQRVLDQSGRLVAELAPVQRGRVDLPPPVRNPVLTGLTGAVARPEGTAASAFAGFPLDRLPVAGKTGTAQVTGKHDTAVFAAFAPVDSPRYAIAVVLEEAGFGGTAAAPVARRVFEGIAGVEVGELRLGSGTD